MALWAGNGSDGAYAEPDDHAHLAARAAAREPADHLPGGGDRQPRPAAGARRGRRRRSSARGCPPELTPLHLAADQRPARRRSSTCSRRAPTSTPSAATRDAARPRRTSPDQHGVRAPGCESKGARFTPLRFDVRTLTPAVHRVAFPWGMMNNVLVFSGSDGAVVVDSGFSTRAVDELRKVVAAFSPPGGFATSSTRTPTATTSPATPRARPRPPITAATLAAPPAGPVDHAARRAAEGPHGADAAGRLRWRVRAARRSRSSRGRACTRTPT